MKVIHLKSRINRRRTKHIWKKQKTLKKQGEYNKLNAIEKDKSWREFVGTINDNIPNATVGNIFNAIERGSHKGIMNIMLSLKIHAKENFIQEENKIAEFFKEL